MPAMLMFLAHQGGWDEALFVAIPLALIFAAVHTAKRRAESRGSAGTVDADDVGAESE